MLTLARPAMVFAAIDNTVMAWSDFVVPLVFLQNECLQTLPQGLTVFMGEYNTAWGLPFAGLTLASLPPTLVYILLSRHVLVGMIQGALKQGSGSTKAQGKSWPSGQSPVRWPSLDSNYHMILPLNHEAEELSRGSR